MGKTESDLKNAFPNTISRKGRGTAAEQQGEGVRGRGKTTDILLERSRALRADKTEAEEKLWSRLRAKRFYGLKFRHQVPFSANYIADFVCPKAKLIVELDGSQHVDQIAYDEKRTAFLEQQGYRVLRFWNNDVFHNIDGVLEAILAALQPPLPDAARLSLSPLGRG
jgi:very-short-patch-repair endonuclease